MTVPVQLGKETTPIPPAREAAFRQWLARNRIADLDAPNSFYDYRGAFMAGAKPVLDPEDGKLHWPDTFKQHGHPTFSVESRYAYPGDPTAGRWSGNRYVPPPSRIPAVNGLSSTGTQLVRDRAYWTQVIHHAAQVAPDDPRYPASRLVAQQALQGLQDWADTGAAKDIQANAPGRIATAAVAFGHGASLGLAGDRDYLQLARETNPKSAFLGDLAGTAALGGIAAPAVAGLSPALGGAVLGGTLAAGRGAIEPIAGLSRAESAALMGVGGAVTGAALGKFVAKLTPAVRTIAANGKRLLGFGVAPADAQAITEAAIRSKLAEFKLAPDVIERAVQSWKTSGELSLRTPAASAAKPSTPVAVRPGETLTAMLPELRATADPLDVQPAYVRAGNPRGLPTGTGRTLPYYPRGGAVEQSMAPLPTQTAPTAGPDQTAVFVNYLRGASTPEQVAARLATLRDLGIPVPAPIEAQFHQLLGARPGP